jgi:hypothetical protein
MFRRGFGACLLFLVGTLWGSGLALALTWLPLPSFWMKTALGVLAVVLSAAIVLQRVASEEASPHWRKPDKTSAERIAASLESLVAAVRESGPSRESLRELTTAVSALPEKLARALPVSASNSTGGPTASPPRRIIETQPKPLRGVETPSRPEHAPSAEGGAPPPVDAAMDLVRAWTRYFDDGDGRFTAAGLQQELDREGLTKARALPGNRFGASDDVLAVTFDGRSEIYLLPNFTTSVFALSSCFEAPKALPRDANVRRLVRPAVGRRSGSGFTIEAKGVIE